MSWCLFRVLAMAFPGLVSWGKAPLLGPFTVSALVGRVPLDKKNRVPLMILSSLEDLDSDQQAQLVATPGSHELPPEAGAMGLRKIGPVGFSCGFGPLETKLRHPQVHILEGSKACLALQKASASAYDAILRLEDTGSVVWGRVLRLQKA